MTRIARPDSSGGCPSSESADYCAKGAPVRSWAAPSARNVHGPYSGHFICPRSGVRPENPTFVETRANARAAPRLPAHRSTRVQMASHMVVSTKSLMRPSRPRMSPTYISSPRAMASSTALSSRLAPIPANASAMRSFI